MSSNLRSQRRRLDNCYIVLSICGLLSWAVCANAKAYRLAASFRQPADTGGGAGRFFTGSPSDHYTCEVCHRGTTTLPFQVGGLPLEGYVPGQTYAVVIDWDDTLAAVAFNLEMTDGAGRPLGLFSVPPIEQLAPADLCEGSPAVVAAVEAGRTLALLSECGAHQATILWTAPTPAADATSGSNAPSAWFSGALVSSNKDASVQGDGVAVLSHVFGLAGQTAPPATEIAGSCAASPHVPRSASGIAWMLGLLGVLGWLRRGRNAVS